MEYQSLKKLFHINEQESLKVYDNRFHSESAHHLGIDINGHEAFYIVNDEIVKLLGDIYSIDIWIERLFQVGNLPLSAKEYLIMSSLVEEIRSTNKIEGIYSTRKEIKDLLNEEVNNEYKRYYGLIQKYLKITQERFRNIDTSLSIRKLYDEILLKDILLENINDMIDGVIFRKEAVEITSGTHTIHTGVIGEEAIINMMDQSLKILNDENINILIRVALFHYLFEYIHPFYNGNGRMGRFISTGYLSQHLSALCSLQLSIGCLHENTKYYKSFEETSDVRNKADLTIFIIQFLEIYLSGLKELKNHLTYRCQVYDNIKKHIEKNYQGKYKLLLNGLLEVTLFNVDGITMPELIIMTGYTQQSIRKMINEINHKVTIIEINNEHKPYVYLLNLDVLS